MRVNIKTVSIFFILFTYFGFQTNTAFADDFGMQMHDGVQDGGWREDIRQHRYTPCLESPGALHFKHPEALPTERWIGNVTKGFVFTKENEFTDFLDYKSLRIGRIAYTPKYLKILDNDVPYFVKRKEFCRKMNRI